MSEISEWKVLSKHIWNGTQKYQQKQQHRKICVDNLPFIWLLAVLPRRAHIASIRFNPNYYGWYFMLLLLCFDADWISGWQSSPSEPMDDLTVVFICRSNKCKINESVFLLFLAYFAIKMDIATISLHRLSICLSWNEMRNANKFCSTLSKLLMRVFMHIRSDYDLMLYFMAHSFSLFGAHCTGDQIDRITKITNAQHFFYQLFSWFICNFSECLCAQESSFSLSFLWSNAIFVHQI